MPPNQCPFLSTMTFSRISHQNPEMNWDNSLPSSPQIPSKLCHFLPWCSLQQKYSHSESCSVFVRFLPFVTLLQLLLDILDLDTERVQARQFVKCPSLWVCLMFDRDRFQVIVLWPGGSEKGFCVLLTAFRKVAHRLVSLEQNAWVRGFLPNFFTVKLLFFTLWIK